MVNLLDLQATIRSDGTTVGSSSWGRLIRELNINAVVVTVPYPVSDVVSRSTVIVERDLEHREIDVTGLAGQEGISSNGEDPGVLGRPVANIGVTSEVLVKVLPLIQAIPFHTILNNIPEDTDNVGNIGLSSLVLRISQGEHSLVPVGTESSWKVSAARFLLPEICCRWVKGRSKEGTVPFSVIASRTSLVATCRGESDVIIQESRVVLSHLGCFTLMEEDVVGIILVTCRPLELEALIATDLNVRSTAASRATWEGGGLYGEGGGHVK
jgi:hypothetical protein